MQVLLEAIALQAASEDFYIGAKERVEEMGAGISDNNQGSAGKRIGIPHIEHEESKTMWKNKPTFFSGEFIDNGDQRDHISDYIDHRRNHSDQVQRSRLNVDKATFLWASDSSAVEAGDDTWADGHPIPGRYFYNTRYYVPQLL